MLANHDSSLEEESSPKKKSDFFSVLAVGDIVGKPGRDCFRQLLSELREEYNPDLLVVNGENIAGGFGLTEKIVKTLFEDYKVDVITTGNHWCDKTEIQTFGVNYPRMLLPANMYNVPSYKRGYYIGKTRTNLNYAVINLIGQAFMKGDNLSPFAMIDKILAELPRYISHIIVDLHAEVTSEKQAMAHYLAGKVALLYGTHTHCQTSDERILEGKTAFITDVGMTGAFDSVIGMDKYISLYNFTHRERKPFKVAKKDLRLCAVYAKFDRSNHSCIKIERVQKKVL